MSDVEIFNINSTEVSTSTTQDVSGPVLEQVLLGILLCCLTIVSVIGNGLVVAAVYFDSRLHAFTNYFIVSLACADLLISLLVMPLAIVYEVSGSWPFGWWVCLSFTTLDILCCTSSILNLCAISLDRYWAIITPFQYPRRMTRRTCPLIIAIVWISSTAISAGQIAWRYGINQLYSDDHDSCGISNDVFFRLFSSTSSFFGPLVVMLFIYIKIFIVARKQQKAINVQKAIGRTLSNHTDDGDDGKTPPSPSRSFDLSTPATPRHETLSPQASLAPNGNSLRAPKMSVVRRISMAVPASFRKASRRLTEQASELKAFKTLSIVMGVFIINWTPFFTVYLLEGICTTCQFSRWLMFVCLWLGYLNSSLNPFIYVFFNKQFRQAFIKVLHLKTNKRRRTLLDNSIL